MCGIVGVITTSHVLPGALLDCIQRLEYRGYDSAGMAVVEQGEEIARWRTVGTVEVLRDLHEENKPEAVGSQAMAVGCAHTRWATHGDVHERNTHPFVIRDEIVIVHNGIIENHKELRHELQQRGAVFESDTDSEVIGHLLYDYLDAAAGGQSDCATRAAAFNIAAVRDVMSKLTGNYAIVVIHKNRPDTLIASSHGASLAVVANPNARFVTSDPVAVAHVTDEAMYLEFGDIAQLYTDRVDVEDAKATPKQLKIKMNPHYLQSADDLKGHPHYFYKELQETPDSVRAALSSVLWKGQDNYELYGGEMDLILPIFGRSIGAITTVGCGSSYFVGMIAQYWYEAIMGLQTRNEIASEYRHRKLAHAPDTLLLAISQSGETADTLAVAKAATAKDYLAKIAICNSPFSSLARLCDGAFLLRCGPEIGVASSKSVAASLMQALRIALIVRPHQQRDSEPGLSGAGIGLGNGDGDSEGEALRRAPVPYDPAHAANSNQLLRDIVDALPGLCDAMDESLQLEDQIKVIAEDIAKADNLYFVGRNILYPVALEGALKMKELPYIHAEGFPGGEIKHGPLALIEKGVRVIALVSNNEILPKMKANLSSLHARGACLTIITDDAPTSTFPDGVPILRVPKVHDLLTPFVYLSPLHLLAYHVALARGTNIDQPRNLAKSVTVE